MKICKKCLKELDISMFYTRAAKCKSCILEYQKTEEFKVWARIRDRARQKNEKRRAYDRNRRQAKIDKEPEKYLARWKLNKRLQRKNVFRPCECSHCWIEGKISLHHEDYSKWYDVIPLCYLCHSKHHNWEIVIDKTNNIIFN